MIRLRIRCRGSGLLEVIFWYPVISAFPDAASKSTMLAKFAQKELIKIKKGKSKYKSVYTNFSVDGCLQIDFSNLGKFYYHDCLILLDEITLDADSRDYKHFPYHIKRFFTLHRHFNVDIIYFLQDFERADKTIRNITYDLWYISRSPFPFFRRFSIAKRIFRNININEYTSELTLGYRFSKLAERLFGKTKKLCYIPKWTKYFDSFEGYEFPDLPEPEDVAW